jgi:hypothetical protein
VLTVPRWHWYDDKTIKKKDPRPSRCILRFGALLQGTSMEKRPSLVAFIGFSVGIVGIRRPEAHGKVTCKTLTGPRPLYHSRWQLKEGPCLPAQGEEQRNGPAMPLAEDAAEIAGSRNGALLALRSDIEKRPTGIKRAKRAPKVRQRFAELSCYALGS